MNRMLIIPRSDWQKTVEAQGFHFHTVGEQPYWDESAYYSFTAAEIDVIEAARACCELWRWSMILRGWQGSLIQRT